MYIGRSPNRHGVKTVDPANNGLVRDAVLQRKYIQLIWSKDDMHDDDYEKLKQSKQRVSGECASFSVVQSISA